MKVFTGRSGCLGKGALRRKAKRRRGLPVVTGLVACALAFAVAAVVATGAPTALADEAIAGAAGTQTESAEVIGSGGEMGAAVADDPAALPAVSADDDQVTVTVPTEVPCVRRCSTCRPMQLCSTRASRSTRVRPPTSVGPSP